MSSLKIVIICLCFSAVVAFTITGCSDANPDNNFSVKGDSAHDDPAWLTEKHSSAAANDLNNCTGCHGSDFAGGISKKPCTQCHMGDQLNVHPLEWGDYAYARHSDYIKQRGLLDGLLSCNDALCHGTEWRGGSGTGPSCIKCHIGATAQKHPISDLVVWSKDSSDPDSHASYVNANGITACTNVACHGTFLEGVRESGMSCISCHSQNW